MAKPTPGHVLKVSAQASRGSTYVCVSCSYTVLAAVAGGQTVLNAGDRDARHVSVNLAGSRVRPAKAGPFNLGP